MTKIKAGCAVAAASLALMQIPAAMAQTTTTTPGATADSAAPAPGKTERKAARKQARAKKNAELKKLEDAGYNPGKRDDSNYPQDIQDAQKKAGIGQPKQ